MSLHQFEYEYSVLEYDVIALELDNSMDYEDKESEAIEEIKSSYPGYENIKIIGVKVIA